MSPHTALNQKLSCAFCGSAICCSIALSADAVALPTIAEVAPPCASNEMLVCPEVVQPAKLFSNVPLTRPGGGGGGPPASGTPASAVTPASVASPDRKSTRLNSSH